MTENEKKLEISPGMGRTILKLFDLNGQSHLPDLAEEMNEQEQAVRYWLENLEDLKLVEHCVFEHEDRTIEYWQLTRAGRTYIMKPRDDEEEIANKQDDDTIEF